MKETVLVVGLVALVLFSGCIQPLPENSQAPDYSTLHCDDGRTAENERICNCIVNEAKNKLTVIIKRNGLLDNPTTKQKIELFLASAKNDLGIENTGITYFDGNGIVLSELDLLIENLYRQKNVAYVIILGDEPDPLKLGTGMLQTVSYTLSLAGKKWTLPPDETGVKEVNPDAYCRDVAISLILPPLLYSDDEKTAFVEQALNTYTEYHNNENDVLGQYGDYYLHIQWENGYPNLGADLNMRDRGYKKERVLVWNHEFDRVETELKKKPYLLYYNVHGSPIEIGLGLNPDREESEREAVYTNTYEFLGFAKENGTPALLVQAHSCYSTDTYSGAGCCWPQTMIETGVWAYYTTIESEGMQHSLEAHLSEGHFLGYTIRKNPALQYIIIGDITAHFAARASQ